jgi:hypothetical protein
MAIGSWGERIMQAIRIAAIIIAAVMLGGCATRYHEMGLGGGVAAEQMTADTWRIRVVGNELTSPAAIQDYVLLKAAETAEAAGATHFQIISGTGTNGARRSTSKSYLGERREPYTTTIPRLGDAMIERGEDVYIRVLKLAPDQQVPGTNVFSAAEIIQFVGPRVKRASG